MLEFFIKLFLKLLGQAHLLPFVQGLLHVGRPTDVAFPKELLGQGATLILSGLNNSMAFQSNTDWVWPMWHERQSDPLSSGFVPTGMNLMTTNLTWRTWTSIGLPESQHEAEVDPVGMVTMGESGWSFFPYLRIGSQDWIPPRMSQEQVHQSLASGIWPVVETSYAVEESILWKTRCEVVLVEEEELVLMEIELENTGSLDRNVTLGMALRPYNPLSISHIHRIKYLDRLWRIHRRAALWLLAEPTRIRIGDRKGSDPIYRPTTPAQHHHTRLSSRSGISAGVSEWDLTLAPGTKQVIVVAASLYRRGPADHILTRSRPTMIQLDEAREQNREFWLAQLETGLRLEIPNDKMMQAWQALRMRLDSFDDVTHFSPGTMLYHHFWIRDSAFIAMTYTQLGLHGSVARKLSLLRDKQRPNGYFCSQEGEWDSNGQAIYWMVNHLIATADQEELVRCWPSIRKGADWIIAQSNSTQLENSPHRGLMPAGFSAEHFGPNDHYYWDAWWSLRGLLDAEWAALVLGHQSERERFAVAAQRLRLDLEKSIRHAFSRVQCEGLPSSPYRKVDSASIGNLVAMAPLDLVKLEDEWIKPTLETLWDRCMHQGMFFQEIVHTGLNTYLSLQLARGFLAIGDDRWEKIIDSVLKHATPTWTWPEAIHPLTGGGCMGDGDHGWAASEYLSFIASVLVRVQDGKLLLGFGVPTSWYDEPQGVSVQGVHTRHGTVDWSLKTDGQNYRLQWKVVRNRFQKQVPIQFRLPISLGFSHPRLSTFVEGRSTLVLEQDHGTLIFPRKKTL